MFSSYFRQFCQRLQKVPPKTPACRVLRLRRVVSSDIYPAAASGSCPAGLFCNRGFQRNFLLQKKLHISSFPKIWSLCLSKRIFLFYCLKSCIQSCDKIFYFLNSNGKTDGIWLDSLIQKLFLCALTVCCSCRMDNKRFYICNICQQ